MKRKLIKIIAGVISLICIAIVVRYISSVMTSTKKYNNLRENVIIETVIQTQETKQSVQKIDENKTAEETLFIEESLTKETTEEETSAVQVISNSTILSEYSSYSPALEIDHEKLISINSDYKGWLNIPKTNISYPVPQGPDNEFYLNKLFETKQYEYAGSLFIDAYSAKMTNQDNLIIYGHNMKNGSMFGTLKKFNTKSFFNSYPYIEFYTKDEKRVYLIFSVRTVSANINSLTYALDEFEVQDYIDYAVKSSEQSRKINLNENGFENNSFKQIITLSTCVGDTSKRLIVNGIRIK